MPYSGLVAQVWVPERPDGNGERPGNPPTHPLELSNTPLQNFDDFAFLGPDDRRLDYAEKR